MAMTSEELKAHLERNVKALKLRPAIGQGTATTIVRTRNGSVTCEIEDGSWKLVADEMPGDGGDGLGPDPGVLARASLGSCLAMGYVIWAALLEVPLESVEVQVDAEIAGYKRQFFAILARNSPRDVQVLSFYWK